MTHRPINETDLHAFVDDQLSPQARAEMEAHLSTHPEDAARVAAFQAQNLAMTEALNPVLSEPVPKRLMGENLRTGKPGRQRLAIAASIAFAAGVFVGAGGATVIDDRSREFAPIDIVASMARAAADAHRVFSPEVLHPVEVRSNEAGHLLQWLSKRLGYPMALPDLQKEGFSLVGGRLLSGAQGPAALFMFETSGGTRVTLYCGRMKSVQESAFRFTKTDGVETVFWTSDNAGFAVTGALEHDVLQRLAEQFFVSMEQEPKRPT